MRGCLTLKISIRKLNNPQPNKEATDKVGTIIFDIPIELQGHKKVENGQKNRHTGNCLKTDATVKMYKNASCRYISLQMGLP